MRINDDDDDDDGVTPAILSRDNVAGAATVLLHVATLSRIQAWLLYHCPVLRSSFGSQIGEIVPYLIFSELLDSLAVC